MKAISQGQRKHLMFVEALVVSAVLAGYGLSRGIEAALSAFFGAVTVIFIAAIGGNVAEHIAKRGTTPPAEPNAP